MYIWLSLSWLVATGLLVARTIADGSNDTSSCSFPEAIPGKNLVYSQSDIDTNLAGCRVIKGCVYIASNFTGNCNLSSIVSISEGIAIYNVDVSGATTAQFLTSINANELTSIGGVGFSGFNSLPMLKYVSMPSLASIGSMELHLGPVTAYLQFPSLEIADSIYLSGSIDGMDFKQLRTVNNSLTIVPSVLYANGEPAVLDYSNLKDSHVLTLNFPLLENTTSLYLVGNFSSIDAPNLTKVTGTGTGNFHPTGVTIAANGDPQGFELGLWKLKNTTQISLYGALPDLHFPSLEHIDGDFSFRGSPNPTNISLTALKNVSSIFMKGDIASYSFPLLRNIEHDLIISSTQPIDCNPALKLWSSVTHISSEYPVMNTTYSCRGSSGSGLGKDALSSGIIIAIGIGCAVLTLMGLIFAGIWQRRKTRRVVPKPPPAYEHELHEWNAQERGRGADVLPDYAPPVPPRDGVRRANVMSWGGETAVDTLPGYEPGGYEGPRT